LEAALNRSRYSHSNARKGALIFVDNAQCGLISIAFL
jgi:hypothetical protein